LRLQNDVAHAGKYPGEAVEPKRVIPFRSAVRQHHKGVAPSGMVIRRKGHNALQCNSLLARPVNCADVAQRNLCQLIFAFVSDPLQRIAVCDGDIGGMLWIGNGKSLYLGAEAIWAEAICDETGPLSMVPSGHW
jgi:hypothetical protein